MLALKKLCFLRDMLQYRVVSEVDSVEVAKNVSNLINALQQPSSAQPVWRKEWISRTKENLFKTLEIMDSNVGELDWSEFARVIATFGVPLTVAVKTHQAPHIPSKSSALPEEHSNTHEEPVRGSCADQDPQRLLRKRKRLSPTEPVVDLTEQATGITVRFLTEHPYAYKDCSKHMSV